MVIKDISSCPLPPALYFAVAKHGVNTSREQAEIPPSSGYLGGGGSSLTASDPQGADHFAGLDPYPWRQ